MFTKKKKIVKLTLSKDGAQMLNELAWKNALRMMTIATPQNASDRALYVEECKAANDAQLFMTGVMTLIEADGTIQGVN